MKIKNYNSIKHFKLMFIFRTEGIAYFIIFPIMMFHTWANADLSKSQLHTFIILVAAIGIVSFITTIITDLLIISPVVKYFSKLVKGVEYSDTEYLLAFKRFLALPYYHSLSSLLRWIIGVSAANILVSHFCNLNFAQIVNLWIILFIVTPLGGVLYFLITELYIQKISNEAVFATWPDIKFKLKMELIHKLTWPIIISVFTPFFILLAFFQMFISGLQIDKTQLYFKLLIMGFIGMAGAVGIAYLLTKTITSKVNIIIDLLNKIGMGELSTYATKIVVMDEFSSINSSVHNMKKNLLRIVGTIQTSSSNLVRSGSQLKNSSTGLADIARELSAIIEETTSAYEEISTSFDLNLERIKIQQQKFETVTIELDAIKNDSTELASQIVNIKNKTEMMLNNSAEGESAMKKTIGALGGLTSYVNNIEEMTNRINDIADQINLLALNASIEAARAGDHGKGFAVVAEEINKLADQTSGLAKNIKENITEHSRRISNELAFVSGTGKIFTDLKSQTDETDNVISNVMKFTNGLLARNRSMTGTMNEFNDISYEIYIASTEQQATVSELTKSINTINDLAQQTSASAETLSQYSNQINSETHALNEDIEMFK